ncbi:hypothetical protein BH09VER1_BH09VER1_07200 [soil metagenome]
MNPKNVPLVSSMKIKFLLPLLITSLTACSSLLAQNFTWTGTNSTWGGAAGNWSGTAVTNTEGTNLFFYNPAIATVFTASTGNTNRVAGNVEFLGADTSSFTIAMGDGANTLRTLRLYTGTATSGGDITVDSGASGTFSILADVSGTRQIIWGPGSGQSAPVENHSILNNSTSATLVIGVEQNQNSAAATTALNLTYGGAGNINVTAPINVTSSGGLRTVNVIKQDSGTLTMSSTNGYNGTTTISGGVLQLGNGGTSGSLDGTTAITDNALLVLNRTDASTISVGITGTGALTQIGSGTTILSGANTFTGTTTISAGTLQVGNGVSLGSLTSNVLIQNSATLVFARAGAITYGGVISGTSGLIEKFNSGTLVLTNASTFSGTTLVQSTAGNNIRLANTNALQNSTVSVSVTNGLQFDSSASLYTIGALTGGSNFALQDIASSAVTLRSGNNNASTTYSGTMSGSGGLTTTGTGTLTLTGANTFTGTTNISAGTVLLSGGGKVGAGDVVVNGKLDISNITSGTYSLSTTQTLSGSGSILASGKTLSLAGTLAPGNSPGTLTVTGGLSLESTSVSNFEINGTGAGQFDRLVDNGLLTLGGTLNLSTGYSATIGNTVDLFDWTTLSGTFASITGTSLGGGLSWDTSNLYTNGTITVVPEPSTTHALFIAAGLMFFAQRLRRRLA